MKSFFNSLRRLAVAIGAVTLGAVAGCMIGTRGGLEIMRLSNYRDQGGVLLVCTAVGVVLGMVGGGLYVSRELRQK